MKRVLLVAVLLIVMLAAFGPAAVLAQSEPVGSCPAGFELHSYMTPGDMEMEHMHAGLKVDLNGDGYICMKPVTPGNKVHVHVDNYLPLP